MATPAATRSVSLTHGSHRYGLVLGLVLVTLMFSIAAPPGTAALLGSTALAGAVLLASLRAAGSHERWGWAARSLLALVLAGSIVVALGGGGALERGIVFIGVSLVAVWAPVAISRGLVRQVLETGATPNAVAGAIAVYLLVGMFFGFLVVGIADIASSDYFVSHSSTSLSVDMYFSFITLCTVGYGDYTPALAIGRGLSVFEAIIGQLYLVTVVAVLVSNLRGRRAAGPGPPAPRAETGAGEADSRPA